VWDEAAGPLVALAPKTNKNLLDTRQGQHCSKRSECKQDITVSSSSSVWGRRLPTECTAAYPGLLYNPRFSFPLSSPEALHVNWRERPLSEKGGNMGEKCPIKFCHTIATSTVIFGFFYMPQSCDMGQTALLPLRRKAY
jgi:hypothetical protein